MFFVSSKFYISYSSMPYIFSPGLICFKEGTERSMSNEVSLTRIECDYVENIQNVLVSFSLFLFIESVSCGMNYDPRGMNSEFPKVQKKVDFFRIQKPSPFTE